MKTLIKFVELNMKYVRDYLTIIDFAIANAVAVSFCGFTTKRCNFWDKNFKVGPYNNSLYARRSFKPFK